MIPRLNRLAGRVWSAREYTDVSHKVFASPRSVVFREMEYALPREALPGVLLELHAMVERERHRRVVPGGGAVRRRRTTSGCRPRTAARTAYVAVHQYHRHDHEAYFKDCAAVFDAACGRPHWGKMHSLDAEELGNRYERFEDFLAVRDEVDPERRFANPYLERVLGD